MNIDTMIGYVLLALTGIAVAIAFFAMLVQCVRNCCFLRTYRKDLTQRTDRLRIHKMLESIGLSTKGYIRRAFSSEVEMHLNRCQQCATTTECDEALTRRDTSGAQGFCPNFPDLVRLSGRRKSLGSRT